jgi:hypothetical protein
MPDQDNVLNEKMNLGFGDFDENQGRNDFGIQDTKLLDAKALNTFLFNTDPDDVQDTSKDQSSTDTSKNSNSQKKQEDQTPPDNKQNNQNNQKEDPEVKKKAFDDFIFDNKQDKKDDSQNQQQKIEQSQDNEPGNDEADDTTYHTLSKDLLRLGVFTKNSEDETEDTIDVKSPEDFLKRFSLEKKKGAVDILEGFLSQYGEDRRTLFDAIFVNGVDVQDYLQSFAKQEALGVIDLNIESNQEKIVRSYYKGLKWDDTKIENRVQKLKDYGDLEDEAKSFHEVLLNKERESAQEIERKKINEIKDKQDKDLVTKKSFTRILTEKLKTQELDGIPLNEKEAAATLDYLTEKKYKLANGDLLSEFDKDLLELNRAENSELKLKLALLLRKKLDLGTIKKTAVTKKSDALFTLSAKNAKQSPKKEEPKSFFN